MGSSTCFSILPVVNGHTSEILHEGYSSFIYVSVIKYSDKRQLKGVKGVKEFKG